MADTTDGFDYDSIFDDDGIWDIDEEPSDSERAYQILDELESNTGLMREFNLLLRQRKIEQINKIKDER